MFDANCPNDLRTYLVPDRHIRGISRGRNGFEIRFECWCGAEHVEPIGAHS